MCRPAPFPVCRVAHARSPRGWDTKDTRSCPRGETMKVLIADDDTYQLDLMDYALRREGYTVLAAINGQQALQLYEAEHPDILLLDVTMPKLNGFEVCRRIRREAATPI